MVLGYGSAAQQRRVLDGRQWDAGGQVRRSRAHTRRSLELVQLPHERPQRWEAHPSGVGVQGFFLVVVDRAARVKLRVCEHRRNRRVRQEPLAIGMGPLLEPSGKSVSVELRHEKVLEAIIIWRGVLRQLVKRAGNKLLGDS